VSMVYIIGVLSAALWAHAAWLYRAARRWDEMGQSKLNGATLRLWEAQTVENRAADRKRVVAQLNAEANENRWREAIIGGVH
jgi:hypothetical protein